MGFGFAVEEADLPADARRSNATTVAELVQELDDGATLLVANEATIAQGPATAQRVNEALVQCHHLDNVIEPVRWLKPWTWPAWVWALWLGIAMVCGGIGATLIALGPVTLGCDEDFLRVDLEGLRAMNDRLVPFIQHDRITMAGCMMAIGFNDIGSRSPCGAVGVGLAPGSSSPGRSAFRRSSFSSAIASSTHCTSQ